MGPRISPNFFPRILLLNRGSEHQNSRKRKLEFSQPTEIFVFFEKPHIEKQDLFCSCVLQILCVEQNYSKTSYSEVKFSALSFKIKIKMIWPPLLPYNANYGTFLSKKRSLQNQKYLKMYISDFLQILQKINFNIGLQVPFLKHVEFCFVSKWRQI
jgi:hypothetical protein